MPTCAYKILTNKNVILKKTSDKQALAKAKKFLVNNFLYHRTLSIQTTKTATKHENDVNSYVNEKFGLNQHHLNLFLAILKSSRLR